MGGAGQEQFFRKTEKAIDRISQDPYYAPPDGKSKYGYYDGRPIIGRGTPINGGVYIGEGVRPAIVVDDNKQPILAEYYGKFLQSWNPNKGLCH